MKLLILGHARHGKDTLCEILRDEYSFKFTSSSDFCLKHIIYPKIGHRYANEQECFEDRVNCRAEWFDMIRAYNHDDPTLLSKSILKDNDIYCGMRSSVEFQASKELFDHIIWVDASNRLPDENSSSCEVSSFVCDFIIPNNDTLPRFKNRIKSLMITLRGMEK